MKDKKIDEAVISKSTDQVFSFVNILRIASKVSDFERWLKSYQTIDSVNLMFEGYKFFLLVCLECLAGSIAYDDSLNIEEDYVFFRARFKGILLNEIPNTCEKAILIKNISKLSRPIRRSKSWCELQSSLKHLTILIKVFDELYKNHVFEARDINKELSLKFTTQFYTYLFLNDTRRGYPHGCLDPTWLNVPLEPVYLERAFLGYVHCLQYLWFHLLGQDKFEKSCIKDLHRASEIYPVEDEEEDGDDDEKEDLQGSVVAYLQRSRDDFFKNGQLNEENDEESRRAEERRSRLKNWFALDKFFEKIRLEIIEPLEKDLKLDFGLQALMKVEGPDKAIWGEFLFHTNVEQPAYLGKPDEGSIRKQLDLSLLWYDLNVLDTHSLFVFNGVPAFIAVLNGLSMLDKHDKVLVRVFRHPLSASPELSMNRNDYSFGVLIPAYGSFGFSDYSGWLVFFDCAGDHSGFAGSLYKKATEAVKGLEKSGRIEFEEKIVDKSIFKTYLDERDVKYQNNENGVFDSEPPSFIDIYQHANDFSAMAKGKLFEYVFHKHLAEEGMYKETKCDLYIENEQIDCTAIIYLEIHIFECKLSLHEDELDETIRTISNKVRAVERNRGKKVNSHLVVYSDIPQDREHRIRQNGIDVIKNFRREIENSRIFDKTRKEILGILNFNLPSFR